jgi:hypothetical protein
MYIYTDRSMQCLRHISIWRGAVLEIYIYIERSSARDMYLYREEQCSRHVSIWRGAVLETYTCMERSSA